MRHPPLQWLCPNCREPLEPILPDCSSIGCCHQHYFDYAKQGYINLLLNHEKKAKNPGDNRDMLEARRRFLNAGHYLPLLEAIRQYIGEEEQLLDLGCGEGYYIGQLAHMIPSLRAYAIDIAKIGIRQASARYKAHPISFAVASTYKIPIKESSVTTLLSVFSPFCPQEALRVLQKNGQLIRVSPAENHLKDIKNKIYATVRPHAPAKTPPGFVLHHSQRLTWSAHLSGATIAQDLIPMTPLHWQGSKESKQALALEPMSVTFDFNLEIYHQQLLATNQKAAPPLPLEPHGDRP